RGHDGRRGICYGARVALVRRRKLREPKLLTSSAGFRSAIVIAATLFFWATLPHPALAQTVSFVAWRDFAAGTNPASVAVDDFNGDGVLDLAVAAAPRRSHRPCPAAPRHSRAPRRPPDP